ncbi:MAG TPA: glycosyltransferase family 4 protein [Terriglobales bacterium]|nr:glycosyltransferase family 4 protein [Terriglobales bacterium]
MSERNSSLFVQSKPKILALLGCYLPGFNSGGPVRTVSCMVEALAPSFEWKLVTLNHDAGSKEVYTSVRTGEWNAVGSGQVYYIPRWTSAAIARIAAEVKPDIIYLNGFFSTSSITALLARRRGLLPQVPIVLATRGDMAGGALGLKSAKKRSYMHLARIARLYGGLLWHASSDREKTEMLQQLDPFGVTHEMVHVAPDLGFGYEIRPVEKPEKCAGAASFATLGRVVRMKNPLFALERLAELKGEITFDVFGPAQDPELWNECQRKIASLPSNVTVRFHGSVEPGRVLDELSQRHFFLLPTLGENYGHVIIEGAAAGCPVVISDRTQWVGLEKQGVGWDIPLDDLPRWRQVLQECIDMPELEYRMFSQRAAEFGRAVMNNQDNLDANIELFRRALNSFHGGSRESLATGVSR